MVMPIYDYECIKCEFVFEEMSGYDKISPEGTFVRETPSCPKCNADTKKLISSVNFSLKGGGWADSGYSKIN